MWNCRRFVYKLSSGAGARPPGIRPFGLWLAGLPGASSKGSHVSGGEALRKGILVLVLTSAAASATAQQSTISDLLQKAAVKLALAAAKANEPQTIEDQIRFCEIPAPSFKETARGEELKRTFQQLGLQNVRVDKAGNVLGDRPGLAPRPRLVMAAHLDTVFPEGTDVRVKRVGPIMHGPGIGDDCRGLAVIVAIVRAMKEANLSTPGSITFVANVGE